MLWTRIGLTRARWARPSWTGPSLTGPSWALGGVAAIGLAVLGFGLASQGEARADDSTSKTIWTLDIKWDHPKRIKLGHEPNVQRFWYLPFTLTNPDSQAHSFFLEVTAVSDKNVKYRSLHDPAVLAKVRRRMGLKPLDRLWSQHELTTAHTREDLPPSQPIELMMPQIPANETVQCVVIFSGPSREMDNLEVRFRGLTNDINIRKTDSPNERILETRELVLAYSRTGDEFYAQQDPIVFKGRHWEIVSETVKTDLD